MIQRNILIVMISLISFQSFGQKNDTIFLLRENSRGYYHAIFIDTSKLSKFYNRISDFTFGRWDQYDYKISLKYLKEHNLKLTTRKIGDIPHKWIILKQYKGHFYTYSPSDYYFHYKISITDTTFIDYTGEGPYVSKILDFNKIDDRTYAFKLTGIIDPDRRLVIHLIDKKNGVAVFEENTKGRSPGYYLMIAADKIRNFPIIVNYCKMLKQVEFQFDKPDYQTLLKEK